MQQNGFADLGLKRSEIGT